MSNTYFQNDHWTAMRDGLAAFLRDEEGLIDHEAEAQAALIMAEAGVCPEACRDDLEPLAA